MVLLLVTSLALTLCVVRPVKMMTSRSTLDITMSMIASAAHTPNAMFSITVLTDKHSLQMLDRLTCFLITRLHVSFLNLSNCQELSFCQLFLYFENRFLYLRTIFRFIFTQAYWDYRIITHINIDKLIPEWIAIELIFFMNWWLIRIER